MFLGHFAVAAATKPATPKVPIWMLFVAAQLMDLLFLPLVVFGVESIAGDSYGQATIHAYYTHSLVGALLIAAAAFWIGKYFWKTTVAAWTLAGLSFSHWLIDLLVHHQDMPILPGNAGGLPLLGFGLWDYTWPIFGVELLMAAVGLAVYTWWAHREARPGTRWYVGPVIVAVLFVLFVVMDHPQLPGA